MIIIVNSLNGGPSVFFYRLLIYVVKCFLNVKHWFYVLCDVFDEQHICTWNISLAVLWDALGVKRLIKKTFLWALSSVSSAVGPVHVLFFAILCGSDVNFAARENESLGKVWNLWIEPKMTETLQLRGQLLGHSGWVTQIATNPKYPDMILSSSRGKCCRWF